MVSPGFHRGLSGARIGPVQGSYITLNSYKWKDKAGSVVLLAPRLQRRKPSHGGQHWRPTQCTAGPESAGVHTKPPEPAHVKQSGDVPRGREPLRGPLDNEYTWSLVWLQKGRLAVAALSVIFCTACNLASPVITGQLFEILAGKQPMSRYPKLLAIFGALYIAEPLVTRVYIRSVCAAGEAVLASLRLELFRVLLMQKIQFFDSHKPSELTALLSSELDSIRSFVFSNVSRDRGPRAILESVGAVAVLFALSWRLGPVLALVIIGTAATAALYKQQTKSIERTNSAALSAMVGVAGQAFAAITTVRSFAGEGLERERFGEYVAQSYSSGLGFAKAKATLESLNRGAIHLSLLSLYGLGGYLVSKGLMPIGVLLSAIGFTFSLVFATQGVVQTFADLRRVMSSVRRIQETLERSSPDPSMYGALPPGAWWENINNGTRAPPAEPYGPSAGDAAAVAAQSGALELRDIHFSYPLRPNVPVLRGLNLRLNRGTVTALVGRSGAGKTTVASLISRFYDPASGSITLAGRDIHSFTRGEWARAVALVSQEPVLFEGTIMDNIGYGRFGHATVEEIETAAKQANAHDFIRELPDGYETRVGRRGALLSGGQRQRIAIARALLKDSPILILDEATSALDATSEKAVQGALQTLVTGRTVLVIAHRLSTVQAATQIAVIEDGHVTELGTHEQLQKAGGLYTELVSSQTLSFADL